MTQIQTGRASLLILSYSPIASDARVLKQVRLFSDRYDVTTCGYGPAPSGVVQHFRIPDELIYWRKNRSLLLGKLYRAVLKRQEVNRYVRSLLLGMRFDVVLADDIDPIPLALELKPNGGVHADLHEYSPGQDQDDWKWRAFVGPYLSWLVRSYATRADSVTTVCKGIADEYRRRFGIEADIVMNATPKHDLTPGPVGSPIRIVHSGASLRNRGLEVMIDALDGQEPGKFSLDFYLTPNDPGYLAELKDKAAEVPGVAIKDPVPYDELIVLLNEYDLGVHLLAPTNFNNYHALPNKFFDFVQARLGVIIGPSPEMAAEVNRYGFGHVLPDFSADSLRERLLSLESEEVDRWKAAAHSAADALSAEHQSGAWTSAIDALAEKAAKRAE